MPHLRLLVIVKEEDKIHVWQLFDGNGSVYFKGTENILPALTGAVEGKLRRLRGKGVVVYIGWLHENACILPLWGAKGKQKDTSDMVFISVPHYAKKYGIAETKVRKLIGREEVVSQVHIWDKRGKLWALFEDKPPPIISLLTSRHKMGEKRNTDWVKWMNEKLSKFAGVRLVRVRALPQHKHRLRYWARHSVLFKGGRFYYFLYNPLGKSLQEIKEAYPNPYEIMFPRPTTEGKMRQIRWEDIVPVKEEDIMRIYYTHRLSLSLNSAKKGGKEGTQ